MTTIVRMSFTQLTAPDGAASAELAEVPSLLPQRRRDDVAHRGGSARAGLDQPDVAESSTGGDDSWQVYSEDWDPSYGMPATFDFDDSEDVGLAERTDAHVPPGRIAPSPMCFIDGRRRVELQLWAEQRVTGARVPGILGCYAVGAVAVRPGQSAGYEGVRVGRAAIWGGGHRGDYRSPAGHHWVSDSTASEDPTELLARLQDRMRLAEGQLALDAAAQGWTVVLDGPLNRIRSLHHLVTGYVKTHRRQLLPAEQHAAVPSLGVGWRTALYSAGSDRYTCYIRVGEPRPGGSRWTGIARLDFPATAGIEAIVERADQLAATLPLYAGQPHRDPRAPVNLTVVRNLENHLGRQMGAEDFAKRAARDASLTQAA